MRQRWLRDYDYRKEHIKGATQRHSKVTRKFLAGRGFVFPHFKLHADPKMQDQWMTYVEYLAFEASDPIDRPTLAKIPTNQHGSNMIARHRLPCASRREMASVGVELSTRVIPRSPDSHTGLERSVLCPTQSSPLDSSICCTLAPFDVAIEKV
jgi:hypothetical protein